MKYYPVNLNVKNRKCLVVGGGEVATRKVKVLLESGATLTVITLNATKHLYKLENDGLLTLKLRLYKASDLNGMFLVFGATNDKKLNRQLFVDASKSNLLCNIADCPDQCNFILPSIVNRGDLSIAISTSGKSPALAKKIRKDLEKKFGLEYAEFLEIMGLIRRKLISSNCKSEIRKQIFTQIVQSDIIEMINQNKKAEIDSLLSTILGKKMAFEILIKMNK